MMFTRRTYIKAHNRIMDRALGAYAAGDLVRMDEEVSLLRKVLDRGYRERGLWRRAAR